MRNVHARFIVGGLTAAVLVLTSTTAQAQVTLRYKFRQGDKLNYEADQKMTMKMNVMGNDINMNMNMKMKLTQEVTGVTADGKGQITQKINFISFDMDGPGVNLKYDSEKNKNPEGPAAAQIAPFFNALANAEFKMTMSPKGEVSDMKIPDAVTAAMKKLAGPGGAGLGDMFSKEGLTRMFGQNIVLPDGPVNKGGTWKQSIDMKLPIGKMDMTYNYKYEGPMQQAGKELQQISVVAEAKLTADPNAPVPVTITIKKQDTKGTILFDNNVGQTMSIAMNQKMEMEVGVGGMNIMQTIDQTTNLKQVAGTK
jgi:hypothetical protein